MVVTLQRSNTTVFEACIKIDQRNDDPRLEASVLCVVKCDFGPRVWLSLNHAMLFHCARPQPTSLSDSVAGYIFGRASLVRRVGICLSFYHVLMQVTKTDSSLIES